MYKELKEDRLVNQVGGRFRLTTLLQKRMVALNQGARPLVQTGEETGLLAVVLQEVREGKIFLDEGGRLQTADAASGDE